MRVRGAYIGVQRAKAMPAHVGDLNLHRFDVEPSQHRADPVEGRACIKQRGEQHIAGRAL